MRKTILVTGGAGFIGSHLCRFLLEHGNRVICVDNLVTGRRANIAPLLENKNLTFLEHDIIDPLDVRGRVDQIYNLACPASPVHYQANPIRTIKVNTIGVMNILGLAKKHSARILQASTSEIYGEPLEHPQKESYFGNVNTIGPRACYDEGKRVAEALFFEYYRQHGVAIRVARIFNTYGPQMAANDGRVVSNFIVQALKGASLTMYGDGTQTRSFCYVSDLVEGLVRLMENEKTTGPVNLGNPTERTIGEIAKLIIERIGGSSDIVYKPLPQDDPHRRKPDITLAKRVLGWEPHVSLEEGLRHTIAYFKEQLMFHGRKSKKRTA